MSKIGYLDYYVAEGVLDINEYFKKTQLSLSEEDKKNFIENTGIKNISVIDKDIYQIVNSMIETYLDKEEVKKEEIRYLVFAGEKTRFCDNISLPFSVQKHFGFTKASIIEINQTCCSTLLSMGMINNMLELGERALIISTCIMDGLERRYIGYTVVGDGVGLMEIMNTDSYGFQITGHNYLSRTDIVTEDRIKIVKNGVGVIKSLLKKMDVEKQHLDYMIPQNINKLGYEVLYSKLLGVKPQNMFLENIYRTGHLGDVDTIVNLKDCLSRYNVSKILLYGLGVFEDNFNYNAVMLENSRKENA